MRPPRVSLPPLRGSRGVSDVSCASRVIHLWAPGFEASGGGIAAFSRELARGLQAEGWIVRRFAMITPMSASRGQCVGGTADGMSRTLGFAVRVIGAALTDRPFVVISTHVNFGPLAGMIERVLGVPYLLVAHGVDIHAGLARWRLEAIRRASGVWAVSRWTRQRLSTIGVDPTRVEIVGNTVDHERFTPGSAPASLRERYGLTTGVKVILTVARLNADEQYKGYDLIVRALPKLVDQLGPVRYLIAGGGDDRSRMETLAASLGARQHVTFCGFVEDRELPDHYRLADVFAMPSVGEGFGIVFLEALACGIPVLGGNLDGTVDALADGELGKLVDPTVVDSIAEELVRLLSDAHGKSADASVERRAKMLARHGRAAFQARVAHALEVFVSR